MNPVVARVVENRRAARGIYRLKLEVDGPSTLIEPGRFFMVGAGPGFDPLLRRPLSLLQSGEDGEGNPWVEFLFEVRGRGTRALSRLRPPQEIDMIGPLGSGWGLEPYPDRYVMVAGGLGVVPLYAAARHISRLKSPPLVDFIYGSRDERGLVMEPEVAQTVSNAAVCTDDGCRGEKGLTTDLLERLLEKPGMGKAVILACGPRAMMRKTARIAEARGVPCQVSLEARMGCGMGACMTCSIPGSSGGNLRVCKDGPVFDALEIDWEALDDRV